MIATAYIPSWPAWSVARNQGVTGTFAVASGRRIVALSEDLRDSDMRAGDSVDRFRGRYPLAPILERDPVVEEVLWEELLEKINSYTPAIFFARKGWCSFEPLEMGHAQEIASDLNVRVGCAEDWDRSEYAAAAGWPGSVNIIDSDREIASLPVGILKEFGFDPEMIERLELFGYRRLAGVRELTRRHLLAQFGAEGAALYEHLRRETRTSLPDYVPPPVLRAYRQFDFTVWEPCEWEKVLDELLEEVIAELGDRRAARVMVRFSGGREGEGRTLASLMKRPSGGRRKLFAAIRRLTSQIDDLQDFDRIELALGSLFDPDFLQSSLFREKERLVGAIRDILRRYPGALLKAVDRDEDEILPERRVRLTAVEE